MGGGLASPGRGPNSPPPPPVSLSHSLDTTPWGGRVCGVWQHMGHLLLHYLRTRIQTHPLVLVNTIGGMRAAAWQLVAGLIKCLFVTHAGPLSICMSRAFFHRLFVCRRSSILGYLSVTQALCRELFCFLGPLSSIVCWAHMLCYRVFVCRDYGLFLRQRRYPINCSVAHALCQRVFVLHRPCVIEFSFFVLSHALGHCLSDASPLSLNARFATSALLSSVHVSHALRYLMLFVTGALQPPLCASHVLSQQVYFCHRPSVIEFSLPHALGHGVFVRHNTLSPIVCLSLLNCHPFSVCCRPCAVDCLLRPPVIECLYVTGPLSSIVCL